MRLCSYVVKYDTGFAPNPFWRYCTLMGCTPNHQDIKAVKGDWIIGKPGIHGKPRDRTNYKTGCDSEKVSPLNLESYEKN